MMKAISIDDEPMALDIISSHAGKIPFMNLTAVFLSATEAFAYLQKEPVDLIFLDISMPDLSGLEFAAMYKGKSQLVFTTAYPEHALKGFELAVTDYLLKPISFTRFFKTAQLALNRMQLLNNKQSEQAESLFVRDGNSWVQIKLSGLLYAKADDNYVSLFERNKRTLTRMTLTELERKLPKEFFVRIHKSYIIAVAGIERVEKHQVSIGGVKIPISKLYRNTLLQIIEKGPPRTV